MAFRSTNQAVVCSRVAPGNYSRLIVLDVSDLANPVQTGSAVIPGTGAGDGCRSLAFDEAGDLWVTTGGVGNLVRMTLDPTGVPISTQVTPLSFPWGAIEMAVQPGTRRLFLSLINSGHIGVVDLTNPSAPATLITNVCESTLGSPQGLEFSRPETCSWGAQIITERQTTPRQPGRWSVSPKQWTQLGSTFVART